MILFIADIVPPIELHPKPPAPFVKPAGKFQDPEGFETEEQAKQYCKMFGGGWYIKDQVIEGRWVTVYVPKKK